MKNVNTGCKDSEWRKYAVFQKHTQKNSAGTKYTFKNGQNQIGERTEEIQMKQIVRKKELIDMNDDKTQEAKKGQEQDKSEISELDKAIRRQDTKN